MASLALGLVGGYFGGPVGYLIGSMLGNLLFPQKVEGPRLTDLHLHTSSYGGMTPIVYGMMRVAGNIDWQTDLEEHSETSGGKGGPEVTTTYTYSASFGVTLCEGPIAGVGKIWANGRKIYDRLNPVDKQGDLPITVYLGTEDQLPDPTMEAHLGVGNVPAYRGLARIIFADWYLTDYSNTIPSLNFEVYTDEGGIPLRVSSAAIVPATVSDVASAVLASSATTTVALGGSTLPSGTVVSAWADAGANTYTERYTDKATGASNGTDATVSLSINANYVPVQNSLWALVNFDAYTTGWTYRGTPSGTTTDPASVSVTGTGIKDGNYFFFLASGTPLTVLRFALASDGSPTDIAPDITAVLSSANASSCSINFGGDGYFYVDDGTTIFKLDTGLSIVEQWDRTALPGTFGRFYAYGNFFAFSTGSGIGAPTLQLYQATGNGLSTVWSALPDAITPFVYAKGSVIPISDGIAVGRDGVISLKPEPTTVTLASIVADLSRRAGLSDAQFDVSGLPDTVLGYLVTQQQDVRSDIDPLRQAYFFDGVEVDDKVVFVKRGGDPIVTIPDDDLAAHVDGQAPPPLLTTDRAPDIDLPVQVTVNFVNAEADYETGTQQDQRQTTLSQNKVTVDLPISLSNEEARAIALTHCAMARLERDTHTSYVPRKYAAYVPTDVISVHGQAIHIRSKSEAASGVIKIDGVPSLGKIFVSAPKAAAGSGFTSSTPGGSSSGGGSSSSAVTTAALLDLPLIDDADDPNGFYAAMAGGSGWPGASLYKSSDGGTSYNSILSESSAQTIGTTTTTMGLYLGGNTFDEVNSVTVLLTSGELSSATELAVLNGANEAVIGAEIVQFKNATLVAAGIYQLTGLLRGRRGTEWAMSHAAGERFVLLPAPRISSSASELYLGRKYKPVTSGATVASATAQDFTNTGVSLRPYTPVLLGGGINASGDVTLNWTRRTRTGGGWANFNDVPLSETSEQYVVQVWDATYTKCARIITGLTSPTTAYTSAQQVSDFGAQQQTIYFTVGQIGATGIGFQAQGTAAGAGAGNNDPLAPISPYQSPTSGSSSPPPANALNLAIAWGAAGSGNVRVDSRTAGAFDCSHIVVAQFTTPASTAAGQLGFIQVAENVNGPIQRLACLSTVAGDFSGSDLGSGSRVQNTNPTVTFSVGTNASGYPQLAPSTTYYYNIKNDDGFGVCTCFSGDCSIYVELSKPFGL